MSQKRIPLPLFRTILFATDLSQGSRAAFDVACALARAEATRVLVLYVNEPAPVSEQLVGYGEFSVPVFLPDSRADDGRVLREQLATTFVPEVPLPIEYEVGEGAAADEILKAAERTACDLLVLGTHGRSGFERLLMGSVAEVVSRHAPCPVVTVRSGATGAAALRTILCTTDFSACSEAALRVARALAREHGARLVLTHVVEQPVVPTSASATNALEANERQTLEALRERTDGDDLKCAVEAQIREGDAARAILAAADELPSDLIVIGTHGRTGVGRLLMGSVAESVMRGASCPVLAVRYPAATLPAPNEAAADAASRHA